MAIYHLSAKVISRTGGRSSVGAAAYRSGSVLTNERDGQVHDYSRKRHVETSGTSPAPRERNPGAVSLDPSASRHALSIIGIG